MINTFVKWSFDTQLTFRLQMPVSEHHFKDMRIALMKSDVMWCKRHAGTAARHFLKSSTHINSQAFM